MDSRQLGRQTSTQVEWQAGRGWWYWGKENTEFKHNRCLVIQTFTSAETGICHCSWYNNLAMSGWRTRGLSRAEMMTEDWWQMCKSDRCRAGENEETPCPRGGDRAERLLGTATAIAVPSPQWAPPGLPARSIRVLCMEISDQGCIKDVAASYAPQGHNPPSPPSTGNPRPVGTNPAAPGQCRPGGQSILRGGGGAATRGLVETGFNRETWNVGWTFIIWRFIPHSMFLSLIYFNYTYISL